MTASIATLLEDALREVAGPTASPTSMTLDYGSAVGDLTCRAWIKRATRSLMFVQAEARNGEGALAAAASAVFRRDAGEAG